MALMQSQPLFFATWLVLCTVLLNGCMLVGPDFKQPQAPSTEDWIESTDPRLKREEADYGAWWNVFKDPVLDALVEIAQQQNLTLQIAGLRVLEARAALGIATGNVYPQLQQASGEVSLTDLSQNAPNQANADHFFYNYQAGFDAAWEFDFWGRFRRGVESAGASLLASIADYNDFLVTLTSEVARIYIVIRTLEEGLEVARQNVEIQKRSLQIADVRFRNGATTELDVQEARTLLFSTQAQIPALEIGLRQAKNALGVLLGIPPREVEVRLGGPGSIPTPPPEVAIGIPADLLRRRPDIRRAEFDAATQSALIGVATSELFPRFTLFGSIGLQSSDKGGAVSNHATFSDLFDTDSITYFLGPTFQWPILSYGRLTNNVRVQDARFQQLLVNYQETVLRAYQEVEDGLVGFLRSQEQVGLLRQSVDAAKRSVDLSLVQYRDGTTDYNRVLAAQQAQLAQQDRLTASRGDIATHLVAVYKALGGGWQLARAADYVPEATKETMRVRTNWGKLLAPEALDQPPPADAAKQLFPRPDW
jgi:NodT family efflux transporter outer membrane factor (OMF) lipoprotein